MFVKTSRNIIQPKLTIGQPNDRFEQEADAVADEVMKMPSSQIEPIQRKCDHCEEEELQMKALTPIMSPILQKQEEEEEVLQMKGKSHETTPINNLESSLQQSKGSGQSLDISTQSFMSRSIGADFSNIKIHTDGRAIQMNQHLNARAFANGNDIYFNQGQYSPHSSKGKHLLAHELTHTIQQKGVRRKMIQKGDFDVDNLPPNASSMPNRIFFLRGRRSIPASEQGKLNAFRGSGTNLTLKGFSSEEGSDRGNINVINGRISSVATALSGVGHTGSITRNVDVAAGAGNIEYQRMRSVEIIPAGSTSNVPTSVSVVPCNDPLAGGANYPNAWTLAEKEAQRLITNGKSKLTGSRSATTNAALTRFFGSATNGRASLVSSKLTQISGQVTQYLSAGNHQCVNQCSGSTASNIGTGASAMLTLCPTFFGSSLLERGATTVHEAVHGTTGISGRDIAYRHHRLIEYLGQAQSIQNPDSYRLFLLTVDGHSPSVGPSRPDTTHGMSSAEENTAKKALAWLEMYLTGTYQQTNTLYDRAHGHRTAGTRTWPLGFYRNMMTSAATHFGVTSPPTVPTTETDQVKLAAVFHRYRTMRNIFWSPVSITKGLTNAWTSGPGNSVEVDASFFALSSLNQVLKLMELLVTAMPDISASLEPHYVTYMNDVRTLLSRPAPPP